MRRFVVFLLLSVLLVSQKSEQCKPESKPRPTDKPIGTYDYTTEQLGISCKGLGIDDVCDGFEFRFVDGCNFINCDQNGMGSTTLIYCRSEGPEDKAECDRLRNRVFTRREQTRSRARP